MTSADGERVTVPQGTVVLQAANPAATDQVKPQAPTRSSSSSSDNVALTRHRHHQPAAELRPTSGRSARRHVRLQRQGPVGVPERDRPDRAPRRQRQPRRQGTLNQHFAVALDNQLLTVPQIDFKQYPDGIIGGGGADITGGFTSQSASDLATQLRLGALPINLEADLELAGLGHAGQAGAASGPDRRRRRPAGRRASSCSPTTACSALIAVAGLIVYGLYFYALIKLIPITLTLAGIAGLILTIGVAADANIVIFERVKEEIRAGRSIRAGIATGYKKGLTAIIDANVVTIMTAFILFVLATSDVQGFAFTLGIGMIVSLFTAVLATQAILDDDGRLADDRAPLGARRRRQAPRLALRLHGRLASTSSRCRASSC